MNPTEQRIVENLARAKDAVVVLEQMELKAETPVEAGANAEIIAANELLSKGIEKLEVMKEAATQQPADPIGQPSARQTN